MRYLTIAALDIGLVNCAQCGCELLGERTFAKLSSSLYKVAKGVAVPPAVYMRAAGRPYCYGCSGVRDLHQLVRRLPGHTWGGVDDTIRAYEGD